MPTGAGQEHMTHLEILGKRTVGGVAGDPAREDDPRWRAVLARDVAWDGAFVFAVATTRIYCRPSCPARRARIDRVRFHDSAAAAASAGFRACRRCSPDAVAAVSEPLRLVSRMLALLDADDQLTLDALAAQAGVSRGHAQRTFSSVMGASPHVYALRRRTERMRDALRNGTSVSTAAYDAGFGSLPRAYAAASSHLGMSPAAYRNGATGVAIRYRIVPCALGMALVAMTARGVARIVLGDDPVALEQGLREEFPLATLGTMDDAMSAAVNAVVAAAAGEAISTRVPIDAQGTAFQQRVWRALMRIPRGGTMTYAELARRVESPQAVRAVGSACGANPVALLVPCHRVVRSDGGLGGYRWGVERKERLLGSEKG
jgi:AraC family transcriptional regulator, regulatory protein of adaptative response / methylated-DNA-[protein]-cysteine methyltransferase